MPVPSCVLKCGSLGFLDLYWWFPLSWSFYQVNKQTNQFNHFLIGFQKEILQRGSGRSLSPIDYNQNLPFQSGAKWMCRDQTESNALAAKPWKETHSHYFMALLFELEPNLASLEIVFYSMCPKILLISVPVGSWSKSDLKTMGWSSLREDRELSLV